MALTETWLGSVTDDHVISALVPRGHGCHAVSRPGVKRGGGLAMLYKSGMTLKTTSTRINYSHFEHSDYYITTRGVTFRLCVVYRPPPSQRNGFTNNVFFDQWSAYLDDMMLDTHDIIMTGDLNFHLDIPKEPNVRRFYDTLADGGMTQLVTNAKQNTGRTVDAVIVRESISLIIPTRPSVYDPCLCDTHGNPSGDHMVIMFYVNGSKPARVRKEITFRRLRRICVSGFGQDIVSSLDLNFDETAEVMTEAYDTCLLRIVDHHAPLRETIVAVQSDSPWYTDEPTGEYDRR